MYAHPKQAPEAQPGFEDAWQHFTAHCPDGVRLQKWCCGLQCWSFALDGQGSSSSSSSRNKWCTWAGHPPYIWLLDCVHIGSSFEFWSLLMVGYCATVYIKWAGGLQRSIGRTWIAWSRSLKRVRRKRTKSTTNFSVSCAPSQLSKRRKSACWMRWRSFG